MGVPQFNNTRIPKFIDSYATTFYAYNNGNYNNKGQVEASPSDSESQSSIFSDYLENGLTYSFIEKYNRQLTIAASALSVVILIILGACVWCVIGLVRKKQAEKEELQKSSKDGTEGQDGSDDLDSSFCTSEGSPFNHSVASVHVTAEGSESKTKGIIAKIFGRRKQKKNDTLSKIYAQHHRNIITPDKSIPFVVPTISLPAQPPCDVKGDLVGDPIPGSETPQPSTSKQALLQAQQFFPQLEHPEVDGCPLIAFTLYYEVASQILNVRLLEGRNFPDTVSHIVGVKIYPGRSGKQATKEFKFRSPVYNVEFCFHVRKISLRTKILKLRAVIPGNPRRVIGYVNVALKDLPGLESVNGEEEISDDLKTTQLWRRVELPSEVGDGVKLQVSLKFCCEPSPGLLTLKIIEAAGLHENRDCDYTSSYVKVTLQEQGRNIKTRKTQLVRWGSVPVFDDVFVLTIPQTLLSQISFLLVIVARGRLGSKAVLGKISIGPVPYSIQAPGGPRTNPTSSSSSSAGMEIWEEMIHQPGKEIIRTLKLN